MRKYVFKPGDKFGNWTVISGERIDLHVLCKCVCGKEKMVDIYSLAKRKTNSCGCVRQPLPSRKGQRFGRWTCISEQLPGRKIVCQCDCGTIGTKDLGQLLSGKSKSCGCLREEMKRKKYKNRPVHYDPIEAKKKQIDGSYVPTLHKKISKNNSSGVKGVSYSNKLKRYRSYIGLGRKQIHLGVYDTLEEAMIARKEAEERYHEPIIEKYKSKK